MEAHLGWRPMCGGGPWVVEAHLGWRPMCGGGPPGVEAHMWWRPTWGGGPCVVEAHLGGLFLPGLHRAVPECTPTTSALHRCLSS